MTTDSNILTWEIPWTEEGGGLESMGSQRLGNDLVTVHAHNCDYFAQFSLMVHIISRRKIKLLVSNNAV